MLSVKKDDIVIYGCRKGRVLSISESGDECVVITKIPGMTVSDKILVKDIHEVLLPADHVFDSSSEVVDWSKVAIDTPVYVRDRETSEWYLRYFCLYVNDTVFVWASGSTSFFAYTDRTVSISPWKHAKLVNICKE